MKRTFKFSVPILFILTILLSGCIFPDERWGDGDHHGHHGGYHSGDRHDHRDGNRGGD